VDDDSHVITSRARHSAADAFSASPYVPGRRNPRWTTRS
jgi:hypothetical protein